MGAWHIYCTLCYKWQQRDEALCVFLALGVGRLFLDAKS